MSAFRWRACAICIIILEYNTKWGLTWIMSLIVIFLSLLYWKVKFSSVKYYFVLGENFYDPTYLRFHFLQVRNKHIQNKLCQTAEPLSNVGIIVGFNYSSSSNDCDLGLKRILPWLLVPVYYNLSKLSAAGSLVPTKLRLTPNCYNYSFVLSSHGFSCKIILQWATEDRRNNITKDIVGAEIYGRRYKNDDHSLIARKNNFSSNGGY